MNEIKWDAQEAENEIEAEAQLMATITRLQGLVTRDESGGTDEKFNEALRIGDELRQTTDGIAKRKIFGIRRADSLGWIRTLRDEAMTGLRMAQEPGAPQWERLKEMNATPYKGGYRINWKDWESSKLEMRARSANEPLLNVDGWHATETTSVLNVSFVDTADSGHSGTVIVDEACMRERRRPDEATGFMMSATKKGGELHQAILMENEDMFFLWAGKQVGSGTADPPDHQHTANEGRAPRIPRITQDPFCRNRKRPGPRRLRVGRPPSSASSGWSRAAATRSRCCSAWTLVGRRGAGTGEPSWVRASRSGCSASWIASPTTHAGVVYRNRSSSTIVPSESGSVRVVTRSTPSAAGSRPDGPAGDGGRSARVHDP